MTRENEEFGVSAGPYRLIKSEPRSIKLLHTGLNFEDSPRDIDDTEGVDMLNMRIVRGGIAADFTLEPLPSNDAVTNSPVLHITSFERSNGTKLVVRMLYNKWQWFNGAAWVDVPGTVVGLQNQRLYSTVMDGQLIVANGSSRLLSWTGEALDSVVELSVEAPAALFVTRIGNRLIAANLKFVLANDLNPEEVAYSADGDIEEWTDVVAGAGDVIVKPEGTSSARNGITGLSNLERGTVVYRERTLVLASRTGVRAAPFRFVTIDFAHGTESPYSIANGGLALGDFFLGYDHVVYHWDGQSPPVPIGLPIQKRLETRISDLSECVGFIDPIKMEYHLLSPAGAATPLLQDEHVFSIRDYIRKKKLSWRYKALPVTFQVTTGAHIPRIATQFIPFVDSLNTVEDRVDPTDPPIHVASAEMLPPPPVGEVVRTGFHATGLPEEMWGFTSSGGVLTKTPRAPTPDWIGTHSGGTALVKAGGYLDIARLVGARLILRFTGANERLMVNPPNDTRFSVPKWKERAVQWSNEVKAVTAAQGGGINGEAKLRRAVREGGFLLYCLDDFTLGSLTFANAFAQAVTYDQIEECARFMHNIFPWIPTWWRGHGSYMKATASLAGAGEWANVPRINGVRQYRYAHMCGSQFRPRFSRTEGIASVFVARESAAAASCGLGHTLSCNMCDQGSRSDDPGYDPEWGCNEDLSGRGAPFCAANPTELGSLYDAALAEPSTYAILIYAYSFCPEYYMLDEIQEVLYSKFAIAIDRPQGPLCPRVGANRNLEEA
jgi:hypothetical protein